ncbi:MAG: hypothetical protein HEQ23_03200 [Tepidisphaera sp.]
MENRKPTAARAAAVLCSLALASAYVAYRSGAMTPAGPKPAPAQDQPLDEAEIDRLLEETQNDRRMMGGSKSGIIFQPKDAPKDTPKDPPKHMGGSKRGIIVEPADLKPKAPAQPSSPK